MDTDVMKNFNTELSTLFDSKNMSKNKIQDISKAALKAHKQYKHVVFAVERLMTKSKPEQRLTVLYVVDSIIRAARSQLKERDTFGPRFLKQFDKFLDPLLKCSSKEKLRMVRTLNLWMSNKVYTEAEVQPFRERCKNAGLETDFEKVEQAVKGKNADMSIYSGAYKKRLSTQQKTRTPPLPMDDGLLGAGPSSSSFKPGPDIPSFVLSEEHINGTISERELLEMIQKFGIDPAGLLSKDRNLLQKVLQTFVSSLTQKIAEVQSEKNRQNGTSLQNVLTKDFEYSDDEEEKEKESELEEKSILNHDEILGLAQTLFTQPAVVGRMTEIFKPISVNPFGLPLLPDNMIPTSSGSLNLNAPPPNLMALQQSLSSGFPGQQLGLANLAGINPQLLNAQNSILLQQRAQLQALQGNPAAQRNLFMLGNPLLNPFALQAGVNPLLELQAAQQQALLNEAENSEKKMAEAKSNNEADRARKEKEKERENKERRKMGLPAVRFGFTIIASRTLWLKKIPTNVLESDLKQAVETCGEASRVKVIGNRACAFITMETRKSANEVVQKLREVSVAKKMVKVYWARSPGMDTEQFSDLWDSNRGVWEVPYDKLPEDLVAFCEGAMLDLESLPNEKKSLYKSNGESVIAIPPPSTQPPPVPQPPPLGFPFHPQMGLPGHPRPPGLQPGIPPGLPPGVPPMFNLAAPPPPGMQGIPGFPPAPPPPGVGPPQGVPPPGFDPNKPPPPMFQHGFNPNAPPPPFGRGAGPMQPYPPRGGMHHAPPPPSFRGGRGNGLLPPPHFDSPRRGAPFHPENGRGRLMDQSEMWDREQREQRGRDSRDRDYDRDRSQFDRRRNDDGPRRRSRWENDDRQDERYDDRRDNRYEDRRDDRREERHEDRDDRRDSRYSRRSPRSPDRRLRRSPSYERFDEPLKKSSVSVEEATVSSTTFDELKEPVAVPQPALENISSQEPEPVKLIQQDTAADLHEDQTDEVPMDLE